MKAHLRINIGIGLLLAGLAFIPITQAVPKPEPRAQFESEDNYLAYHRPQELDDRLFEPTFNMATASGSSYGFQKILVGLEVNDEEVLVLDIIKTPSDYLVPIKEVFPAIGASYSLEHGIMTIQVPGSDVEISSRVTYRIDGDLWASLGTLNRYLKLNASFDPTTYAINFLPPWRRSDKGESGEQAKTLKPEYYPDAFSLRQFRISHQVEAHKDGGPFDFDIDSERSDLLTSGAAWDGSWLFEANKVGGQSWRPDEYFWLKRDDHQQWLLGKQVVTPSVVAPSVTLTGAQYFYSNQSIPFDPYQDISQSRFFRELGSSVQTIRGNGEPGAIAQLYVNQQLVDEVFVDLDGSYDFGEVRSESGLYNEIEVVIIDSLTRTEIERQDKTRLSSDNLLNEGQMVTSVAFGKKGNWLDPDFDDQGEAGMLLYRYGVSDSTTVETGYLLDDDDTMTAGVASALGSNFVGAYRVAKRNDVNSQQLELDGTGQNWRLSTFVKKQEAGFVEGQTEDATTANSYFYYTPDANLRLEMIGRYQERGGSQNDVSYVKPGVFYSPTDNFSVAMRPDYDGAYRTELYYRPYLGKRFRVTHRPDEQTIRFDYDVNDDLQGYMSGRMYEDTILERSYENTVFEEAVGFYWQPRDWTRYDRLRVELNHSREFGMGMFAEYRTQLAAGLYFDLRLRDADPRFDGGFSAFARISLDFAVAGDRFIPATQRRSYNTHGTIAGTLNMDTDDCDIEHVSVLVDGANRKVPVSGCTFYLEKVTPGIHTIALDGEYLPIEVVPDTKEYVAQVTPSSVTRIDFALNTEYSASGQVTLSSGKVVPNARVTLLNSSGEVVMQTLTDQFGYFRVDSLSNGRYSIQVKGNKGQVLAERKLLISNDFVFGADIQLPATLPLK
ncbi:carboxypeptidase-like regulatory domain-containing protein [Kangiella sediminilitoris]|uniref:Uncharacterized protein n=1 Tax=Kangiella sediminilitoris TaxID=1144748 RepID=A0A1B3B8K8_9GAMM|nr:carboxypeptidase-like regulatory domain-containing protein [Kangiella sediminilitoris]AOE49086.1 hypothetical protein KS2013_361 [Kangiella sediminilitoris]